MEKPPSKKPDGIRMSELTSDEDGIPIKYARLIGAASVQMSPQDQDELLSFCDKLEAKEKVQKAANLLYPAYVGNRSNEALGARWRDLILKVNQQQVALKKKAQDMSQARHDKIDAVMGVNLAPMSDTQRYDIMLKNGAIPAQKDPNWHLGKLKPWLVKDALQLGQKYKAAGDGATDPFQKIYQYEEACKMFVKILELKTSDDTARSLLDECCTAMNAEYVRMKKIKRLERAKEDSTMAMTTPGDFLRSKNEWVKQARGPR